MFHRNDDPTRPCCEVHGPADRTTATPRNRPIRKIPSFGHLQAAQDGDINVAASDHGE
jgi:hypothetical protein